MSLTQVILCNRNDEGLKAMSIGISNRIEEHADITVEGHANVVVNIDELLKNGGMGDGAGGPRVQPRRCLHLAAR